MTDGVLNIADTEFGKKLAKLAGLTARSVHELIASEPSFMDAVEGSLTTYMLNENMVFMQFIQALIDNHTQSMARAYQNVVRRHKND